MLLRFLLIGFRVIWLVQEQPWNAKGYAPDRRTITLAHAECVLQVWAPVLHADEKRKRLLLFYAESNRCLRPTTPPTWEPGMSDICRL